MKDISAIKVELLKTLVNNLKEPFTTDENIFLKLKHFIKLKEEVNIKQVHTFISADLNLRKLSLQYNDLLLHSEINIFRKYNIRELVIKLSRYGIDIKYPANNLSTLLDAFENLCALFRRFWTL